jgi:hypothetical protein
LTPEADGYDPAPADVAISGDRNAEFALGAGTPPLFRSLV